jgi:hypothetical protein
MRFVARPDDYKFGGGSKASAQLGGRVRDILSALSEEDAPTFRLCAGVDGVRHSAGLLSRLFELMS